MADQEQFNDHLVLIGGESATGKSASLRNLDNQAGTLYLNCEAGKRLPFPNKFKNVTITDPLKIYNYFTAIEQQPTFDKIVIDSQTFLMDMFISKYVQNATNTMKAWGNYAEYFKVLMQDYVAASSKAVIFTAHVHSIQNEESCIVEKCVPVKGSLGKNGIEAYFSCVVACKKLPLAKLEDYDNSLLTITDEEAAIGVKYVFQTRLTKDTVNERIRSPMGMWEPSETFIDNDAQLLLNRLTEYYG